MLLSRIAAFAAAAGVTSAWFINACDWVYTCGCRSWWSGAATSCNIHVTQGPHCPWCLDSGLGGYVTFAFVLLAQGFLSFYPGKMTLRGRLFWAFASFPIGAGLWGLVFGWVHGYWRG